MDSTKSQQNPEIRKNLWKKQIQTQSEHPWVSEILDQIPQSEGLSWKKVIPKQILLCWGSLNPKRIHESLGLFFFVKSGLHQSELNP